MAPKNERQKSNRNPGYHFVFSAASKKKEEERTAQKDRTPKWIKTKEGKVRVVAETCENTFVDVPGNRVERKQSMFVPRFIAYFRDMKVTKIEG